MKLRAAHHWNTVQVCWLAAWCAIVALVHCGLNTPEEIRKGKEAWERWRRARKSDRHPECRIFGGFQTHIGVYPFAIYMQVREHTDVWHCSGSIVGKEWVLSARHCGGYDIWEGVIFAGDVDFTTDKVFTKYYVQIRIVRDAKSYIPPTPDHKDHDIMMVHVWRGFTSVVGYVTVIPITEERTLDPGFKQLCTVVGFGRRGRNLIPDTGLLRGASFLMEHGSKCGYSGITDNGLCTFDVKKKSACFGDSGGPILCNNVRVQFGMVVAALYENCTIDYCGAPVTFNIHLFLGFYREWIMRFVNPPVAPGRRDAASHAASAPTLALSSGLALSLLRSLPDSLLAA
ncbi:mast cell protease 1A-like [Schistocerca piceifrons]|uniref:mast cell protease 1A-like n=1 Tax=Schistocerca piceifrons TaxID=274613 RepID=UPI001F5F4B6B|nr:mast cell protease 1A-like [Schistocerca piceifrons]